MRHRKPCNVTLRPGSPSSWPFTLRQCTTLRCFRGETSLESQISGHISAWFILLWNCGKLSRLETPQNSSIFLLLGFAIFYFFLPQAKELWNT